jgi:hypothetical protein
MKTTSLCRGYRFPPDVIAQVVWLYHRYTLSVRCVEDLLAERGVTPSYEVIRRWCTTFGRRFAGRNKARLGRRGSTSTWRACGNLTVPAAYPAGVLAHDQTDVSWRFVELAPVYFFEGSKPESASKRRKSAQGELLSFWRCKESAANPSLGFP